MKRANYRITRHLPAFGTPTNTRNAAHGPLGMLLSHQRAAAICRHALSAALNAAGLAVFLFLMVAPIYIVGIRL